MPTIKAVDITQSPIAELIDALNRLELFDRFLDTVPQGGKSDLEIALHRFKKQLQQDLGEAILSAPTIPNI
ncbi:MAG: hypothetical protein K2X93_06805 [Candidatus Obscuribacterales bacterium]|nr:hypothetical protein [Candidatus Obscuribacterales bacterium]